MKVFIQLDKPGGLTEDHTIIVKDGLTGSRLIGAISREVDKINNVEWERWNLVRIE